MRHFFLISILTTLFCSTVLLTSPYIARENDSRLYARIVNDQAERPWSEFIAPKWNGAEHYAETETPYFRDHLAGIFFLPTIFAKLGMNGMQATYVCSLLYKTLTLFFFFLWLRQYVSTEIAGLIVLGLQLNPQSMNYTLRANHEALLLLFMVFGIWANNTKRYSLAIMACVGSYLTKGLPGLILAGILALETVWHHRKLLWPSLRFVSTLLIVVGISYAMNNGLKMLQVIRFLKNIFQLKSWDAPLKGPSKFPFLLSC